MTYYTYLESPVGRLMIVGDESALREIRLANVEQKPREDWKEGERGAVGEAVCQLKAYFSGKLRDFDLAVEPAGTPFQKKVWRELCNIPYGTTISYGELAKRVGNAKASRAVGAANGDNPIPIVIPCHRVIGSNGKLTGYGGGLPVKEKLLTLESRGN